MAEAATPGELQARQEAIQVVAEDAMGRLAIMTAANRAATAAADIFPPSKGPTSSEATAHGHTSGRGRHPSGQAATHGGDGGSTAADPSARAHARAHGSGRTVERHHGAPHDAWYKSTHDRASPTGRGPTSGKRNSPAAVAAAAAATAVPHRRCTRAGRRVPARPAWIQIISSTGADRRAGK
jgi:hypothetical protein